MTTHYHLFGAKGGVGTTAVAAALALTISEQRPTDIRATDKGDMIAMLGLGGLSYPDGYLVAPNLTMFGNDGIVAVNDNGTNLDAADSAEGLRLLVTRGCYLALRRTVHNEGLKHIDGIVLVDEPGRALGRREVSDVLGKPIVATVPVTDLIARAIDAGVLCARLPQDLRRAARDIMAMNHPAARFAAR